MTKTMSVSARPPSTSCHSRSLSGDPKLYAATWRSSLCARLISRSAFRSGASKLDPTYAIVIFNPCYRRLRNTFELVFKIATNLFQSLDHILINLPIPAPIRFQQTLDQRMRGVRIQISQPLEHRLIKQKRVRDFRVDPIVDRISRRTPPESIRNVILNLGDAAETVFQHAFVPLRIQRLRARLESHCFFQRANLHVARKRIRQINRGPRLRTLLDRLRHATEILEIVIDIRQPDLERVDVLVSRFDARECAIHCDPRFPALDRASLRVATVRETLARHE